MTAADAGATSTRLRPDLAGDPPGTVALVRTLLRSDLRERARGALLTGLGLAALAVMTFALYPSVADSFGGFGEELPEGVANLIGSDYSTLVGWVDGQLVAGLLPLALLVLGGAVASGLTAGREESGELALPLSTPAGRREVVASAFLAAVGLAAAAALVDVVGFVVGDALVDDDLGLGATLVTHLHLWSLAVVGAGLGLLVSALVARRVVALSAVVAVAVLSFLVSGFAPTLDGFGWLEVLSPVSWALAHDPLTDGVGVGGLLAALGVGTVLVAAAVPLYDRRDLDL